MERTELITLWPLEISSSRIDAATNQLAPVKRVLGILIFEGKGGWLASGLKVVVGVGKVDTYDWICVETKLVKVELRI